MEIQHMYFVQQWKTCFSHYWIINVCRVNFQIFPCLFGTNSARSDLKQTHTHTKKKKKRTRRNLVMGKLKPKKFSAVQSLSRVQLFGPHVQ